MPRLLRQYAAENDVQGHLVIHWKMDSYRTLRTAYCTFAKPLQYPTTVAQVLPTGLGRHSIWQNTKKTQLWAGYRALGLHGNDQAHTHTASKVITLPVQI